MKLLQLYQLRRSLNTYCDYKGNVYSFIHLISYKKLTKTVMHYNYYHNLLEKRELYAFTKSLPKQPNT